MEKYPKHLLSKINGRQVVLWKCILWFIFLLLVLVAAILWQQESLFRHFGYSKTQSTLPANTYSKNALNPSASQPPQNPEPEVSVQRDSNLIALYNDIRPGNDKDMLIRTASTSPSSCPTIQVPSLGAEEICTWINNEKAVIFTLLNNVVISKAKSGF